MPSSLQLHRINPNNPTTDFPPSTWQQHKHAPTSTSVIHAPSVPDYASEHHAHEVAANQCCSAVVQEIHAPAEIVWSVVRRFDKPQAYKHFLKSCHVIDGDGDVGTLREVRVVSGLPAESSTERLEILDEERHVISFSVVGGDHRLNNYRSVTTLHALPGGAGTAVVESYVVDVPAGNTKDETCGFVDTIVRCNLQSLTQIAETMARAEEEYRSRSLRQQYVEI